MLPRPPFRSSRSSDIFMRCDSHRSKESFQQPSLVSPIHTIHDPGDLDVHLLKKR